MSSKKDGFVLFAVPKPRKYTPSVPTTYSPLWRRLFVNERKRAEKEKQELFDIICRRYETEWPHENTRGLYGVIFDKIGFTPDFVNDCIAACVAWEYVFWPPKDTESLAWYLHFLNNREQFIADFVNTVSDLMGYIHSKVRHGDTTFTVPLYSFFTVDNLEEIIVEITDQKLAFQDMREAILDNAFRINGIPNDKQPKGPVDLNLSPIEALEFLHDTPLYELLNTRVPLVIPFNTYFEHTHVVGGSGAGKTVYLSQFILDQIRNEERPAIIIVDSQDNLIHQVRRLEEIQDRVTYIDPANPPSINLFEGGGAFDTYKYLFKSILDMELTGKQETFFRFAIRLLQEVPNATLKDLFTLTGSTDKYQQYIAKLPEPHREFFENDYNLIYKDTRAQVRTRLQGVVSDDTLFQFLWSGKSEIDILQAIHNGGILLVDTSRNTLGDTSSMFGKVFIFLIMKAIYSRKDRHPVFLVADEIQEYFSSTIDNMLNQMRKFRCGCVFAHQNLNQATPELRASLASSTSIKLCGQPTVPDAKVFAQEMRTTPEFILDQPRLHFAFYARGVTDTAVSIEVTPGILERQKTVMPHEAPRRIIVEHEAPKEHIDAVDDTPSETL